MAERSHLRLSVQDEAGNSITNALCQFYVQATTTPLAGVWTAASGGSQVTSRASDAAGTVEVWLDTPQSFDVATSDNGHAAYYHRFPTQPLQFAPGTFTVEAFAPPDSVVLRLDVANTWTADQRINARFGVNVAPDARLHVEETNSGNANQRTDVRITGNVGTVGPLTGGAASGLKLDRSRVNGSGNYAPVGFELYTDEALDWAAGTDVVALADRYSAKAFAWVPVYDPLAFSGAPFVASGCAVTADGPNDMGVTVAAGSVQDGQLASVAVTGAGLVIGAADANQARLDLIVASLSTGATAVQAGTAMDTPVRPTIPVGWVALAVVSVPAGATSIDQAHITDIRPARPSPTSADQWRHDHGGRARYSAGVPACDANKRLHITAHAQDSAQLQYLVYIDAFEPNRTPVYVTDPLLVAAGIATLFTVRSTGDVGIGTQLPQQALHVTRPQNRRTGIRITNAAANDASHTAKSAAISLDVSTNATPCAYFEAYGSSYAVAAKQNTAMLLTISPCDLLLGTAGGAERMRFTDAGVAKFAAGVDVQFGGNGAAMLVKGDGSYATIGPNTGSVPPAEFVVVGLAEDAPLRLQVRNPNGDTASQRAGISLVAQANGSARGLLDLFGTSHSSATLAGNLMLYGTNTCEVILGTQSLERLRVDVNGNVSVGTAALGLSATNGFLYIPSMAGVPIGVPTAKAGLVPLVYDSTDNKLYVYNAGWKAMAAA